MLPLSGTMPPGHIKVGDEVNFNVAKLNKTVKGKVIEVIAPFGFPSNDLMEAIAGTGRHSFKPCDHVRYAIQADDTGEVYIPFGRQAVQQSASSFRLESYALDEVAVVTKKQVEDVRIGKRDIKALQELSTSLREKLEEVDQVLARLAAR